MLRGFVKCPKRVRIVIICHRNSLGYMGAITSLRKLALLSSILFPWEQQKSITSLDAKTQASIYEPFSEICYLNNQNFTRHGLAG